MKNEEKISRETFRFFESSLMNNLHIDRNEFEKKVKRFKEMNFQNLGDDEILWILTYVNFYSGFRSVTIESKLLGIKQHLYGVDKMANYKLLEINKIINSIGFPRKVNYAIENAECLKRLFQSTAPSRNISVPKILNILTHQ